MQFKVSEIGGGSDVEKRAGTSIISMNVFLVKMHDTIILRA